MSTKLNNLGTSFQTHFYHTGDFPDIDSAISSKQWGLKLTPEGHADLPAWLNNLGISFQSRFGSTSDVADIKSAISFQQRAIELTPEGHADLPSWLNNLGTLFQSHFDCTGDLADIENAISFQQKAIKLTPEGNVKMPLWLNSLGISFQSCFNHTSNLADIESAIFFQKKAIKLTPEGHAKMSSRLNNLGNLYASTNEPTAINQAVCIYSQSATYITGHPLDCFYAAQKWASLSYSFGISQSIDAFHVAIKLLSQVVGLEQTIYKRHNNIAGNQILDLVTFATATAIQHNQIETALVWLEQGRCLVWKQLDQLCTPVNDLQAHDPSLASHFLQIACDLDASGFYETKSTVFSEVTIDQVIADQDKRQTHVNLAQEWTKLLSEIHHIPGFEHFLQPPNISDLLSGLLLRSCYLIIIQTIFHFNATRALPPSLFFVIAHSAIHAFLIS